jgi:hypothetical protein
MSAACDDGGHGCCVQPRALAMYASGVITRQATTVLVPGVRTHVDEYMQYLWLLQPLCEQLRAT